ncbi:MAG: alpha/beta hydrolase [Gaiellaceae bacterium]
MDPQGPLENVAAASRSLPNSQILVIPGAGHGSVQLCVPRIAMRFFSSHQLTSADRVCRRRASSAFRNAVAEGSLRACSRRSGADGHPFVRNGIGPFLGRT